MAWASLVGLQGAENAIQISTKSPAGLGVPAGSGPAEERLLTLTPPKVGNPSNPGVDVLSLPNNPPLSLERQKSIEGYLDRQQNWMFADPKDGRKGGSGGDGSGGNDLSNAQGEKKAVERYWEREREGRKQNTTNRVSEARSEEGGDENARQSIRGLTPVSEHGSGDKSRGRFAATRFGSESSRMEAGGLETAGIRLPDLRESDAFRSPSFQLRDAIGFAGTPAEPIRKESDWGLRPIPIMAPLEFPGLKADSVPKPAAAGLPPGAGQSSAPSLARPSALDAATAPPGLAIPGRIADSIGSPLGGAFGGGPGFGGSFAAPASSLSAPVRPAVLEFPKRSF